MRILSATLAVALACDTPTEPTTPREAPDVPWPAIGISGPLKSPGQLSDLLVSCFMETDYSHGQPPSFIYKDEAPDGDDQQPSELCIDWAAHLDVSDCVRLALIDLGGVPEEP